MNDSGIYFFSILLFFSAIGMLVASAITLSPDSDRCVLMKKNNGVALQKESDDAIVAGGFGVAAAVFAFCLALILFMNSSKTNNNNMRGMAWVILAAIGFAVIGSLLIVYSQEPSSRCPMMRDDGRYSYNGLEILAVVWSTITIGGLLTPIVGKYLK